jgi:hypothetical protein
METAQLRKQDGVLRHRTRGGRTPESFIGRPDVDGKHTSNASITGNGPHNRSLCQVRFWHDRYQY